MRPLQASALRMVTLFREHVFSNLKMSDPRIFKHFVLLFLRAKWNSEMDIIVIALGTAAFAVEVV